MGQGDVKDTRARSNKANKTGSSKIYFKNSNKMSMENAQWQTSNHIEIKTKKP